jgi:hypothetical protein
MKKHIRKYTGIILGICFGVTLCLGTASVYAAGQNSPGNPSISSGQTGSNHLQGQNPSGRFTSIQGVGIAVIDFVQYILIPFIMILGMLTFLWGVLKFIKGAGEPTAREEGRQFMVWGIVGLAVMASVWGLVRILTNTIGSPFAVPTLNSIR